MFFGARTFRPALWRQHGDRQEHGAPRRAPRASRAHLRGGGAHRRAARARPRVHRAARVGGHRGRGTALLRRRPERGGSRHARRCGPAEPPARESAGRSPRAGRQRVRRPEDPGVNPSLLPLGDLSRALDRGEARPSAVLEECLSRTARLDGKVHAFLRLTEGQARAAARASDERRARKEPLSPLDGVPVGLKDLFCQEGVETTAGSRILEGYHPPYDATVVRKLREAGAGLVGKLNMDEVARGSIRRWRSRSARASPRWNAKGARSRPFRSPTRRTRSLPTIWSRRPRPRPTWRGTTASATASARRRAGRCSTCTRRPARPDSAPR